MIVLKWVEGNESKLQLSPFHTYSHATVLPAQADNIGWSFPLPDSRGTANRLFRMITEQVINEFNQY